MYWFCHISEWICHRYTCVPHPEPSSLLPSHTIPTFHIIIQKKIFLTYLAYALILLFITINLFPFPTTSFLSIFKYTVLKNSLHCHATYANCILFLLFLSQVNSSVIWFILQKFTLHFLITNLLISVNVIICLPGLRI